MKIINLTPHAVSENYSGKTFLPEGYSLRVETKFSVQMEKRLDDENDISIPFFTASYGPVELVENETKEKVAFDVLPKEENCILIVSSLVRMALNKTLPPDLYGYTIVSPGELVRDSKGNPVGCNGFVL